MKRLFNKKGFTLMELIGAIGIIAILCAIAIPTIAKLKKSTDTQQQNDYAKSIYLAAQDNLSSLKVNGSIVRLSSKSNQTYPSVYQKDELGHYSLKEEIGKILGAELQQELASGDEKHQYVYVEKAAGAEPSDAFRQILPEGSIDESILKGKKITIVFNPVTGDVLYVQYGEGNYHGSVVNSAAVLQAGGGTDNDGKDTPEVIVTNSEELMVTARVKTPSDCQNPITFFNAMSFTVTVSDVNNADKKFTMTVSPADGENSAYIKADYGAVNCSVSMSLDSLCDGQGFLEKFKAASGSDFTGTHVDITVTCDDSNDKVSNDDVIVRNVDPLFAENTETTVKISNGRHLQNLDSMTSTEKGKVTTIQLEHDIAWGDTVLYYQDRYRSSSEKVNGVACGSFMNFVPLNSFSVAPNVTFDGNGKTIKNLYVQSADTKVGLFKTLGCKVSNLTLEDPMIKGTGNAGALAAELTANATVTNCSVLIKTNSSGGSVDKGVSTTSTSKGVGVGLLCGNAVGAKIKNAVVSTGNNVIKASGNNFGLLVGGANNITVEGATIDGKVTGADCSVECFGGVVGCVSSGSYSGLNVRFTLGSADVTNTGANIQKNVHNAHVGGIFGYANGVTVSKGTAVANNTVTVAFTNFMNCSTIGGVAGYIGTGAFSDITLTGTMNDIVAPYLGGAFGEALEGTYQKIDCSADMYVQYVWPCKNAGSPLASFTGDSSYICPAGLGYAGKFVGYTDKGKFTDCSGTGESTGNYANIQFLGCVNCQANEYTNANYYKGTVKKTGSIEATPTDNTKNTFSATGISFTKLTADYYYTYTATLSNCTYKDAAKAVKTQEIAQEEYYYYLMDQKGESDPSGRTSMQVGDEFIITRKINGKLYMLVWEKKIIKASEINSLANPRKGTSLDKENQKLYRQVMSNNKIYMWDMEYEFQSSGADLIMEHSFHSYYYDSSTNLPYEPNQLSEFPTSQGGPDTSSLNYTNAKNIDADIYRYVLKTIEIPAADVAILEGDDYAAAQNLVNTKYRDGVWMVDYPNSNKNNDTEFSVSAKYTDVSTSMYMNCFNTTVGLREDLLVLAPDADVSSSNPVNIGFYNKEPGKFATYREQKNLSEKYVSFSIHEDSNSINGNEGEAYGVQISRKVSDKDDIPTECYLNFWITNDKGVTKYLFEYKDCKTSYRVK